MTTDDAGPPSEVLEALEAAAEVIAALESRGLRLHFELGETGAVRILVIDDEGRVVEEMAPQAVASLLSGGRDLDGRS